jgi:histidine triad (HIT) family protein
MTSAAGATLFERIVAGSIPCAKVYEDDTSLAFRDIAPVAPTHILVIPKSAEGGRLASLSSASAADAPLLGHLLWVAAEVARREGVAAGGYRIVINDGAHGCQAVPHLHLHLIAGKQLSWPPGTGAQEGPKAVA